MQWSYYNFLLKSERFECYLLYNSLSNVFLKLDKEQYDLLLKMKENPDIPIDEGFRKNLCDNKILVEDNLEEYYKFKLLKSLKRYDRSYLSLTIAPTSDCNFRCCYCFEDAPQPIYMTDQVQNDLISFIKSHGEINHLSITWYGGEPLMAFDRIVSITNEIKRLNVTFDATIITNGYYLDEKVLNSLEELHIRTIHITIDGLSDMHNRRRPEKTGKDSFTRIIDNISLIRKLNISAKVVIRVNVDKENVSEYHEIYAFVKDKYRDQVVNIYPGFVKKTYGVCSYAENNLLSNEEQAQFVLDQYRKYNIMDNTHFLPVISYSECLARCLNAYLVAPDGYLYKCWTDLGNKEKCVGNLSTLTFDFAILAKYMIGGDPFSDKKCQLCKFLPVCGGGCPHLKLKNMFAGCKADLCHISKNKINEFLELYYEKYCQNTL